MSAAEQSAASWVPTAGLAFSILRRAAADRRPVRLADGEDGVLLRWARHADKAKVATYGTSGRPWHLVVRKADVVAIWLQAVER